MKKILLKLFRVMLYLVPYTLLIKLYDKFVDTSIEGIFEGVYNSKFYKKSKIVTDLDLVIEKAKNNQRYLIINEGQWQYKMFNFCFVKNMLSLIIYALERGFIPVINVRDLDKKNNLWEQFLKQPFDFDISYVLNNGHSVCPKNSFFVYPLFSDVYDKDMAEFWGKIINRFVKVNEKTERYFYEEYKALICDKKVIGCVIRGTDYIATKPKDHPIQPDIDEILAMVEEIQLKFDAEYIYLATEEKGYFNKFQEKFGDRVLVNKRNYFDEEYSKMPEGSLISGVSFNRENDSYHKALEYFSSINLVSKCDFLVAGLCGGSEIAYYLNNGKYLYSFLFRKGYY